MKIVALFDNPETVDRYTAVIETEDIAETYDGKYWPMLGFSEGGTAVSQWSDGIWNINGDNSHLGRETTFENLSAASQAHLAARIFSDDE